MPPRRKVPYREVEVTQELTAKPPSWKKIERSIGCTLSNDVRTQLQGATRRICMVREIREGSRAAQ